MADHTSNAILRDSAFRAPESAASGGAQQDRARNPLSSPVIVYSLPADKASDQEALRAFHLYLQTAGTSGSSVRSEWQNYLATIVCLCFRELKPSVLQNPGFQETVLPSSEIVRMIEWKTVYEMATTDADGFEEAAQSAAAVLKEYSPNLALPSGNYPTDVNLEDSLSVEAIFGHFSLVLFLGGKSISDANRVAITQKRPGAIERKYFNGTVVGPLQGALRLSTAAHLQIHSAFVSLSHLRKLVYGRVAQLNNLSGDPAMEVVATTTRLMRFAGMQQAILIDQYLAAHEEAFRIPILMPAIQAYTASMKKLTTVPAEQRPYFKLINGDTSREFNRNDLSNLIVVAVTEARETNPTMMQYNIPANHQLIMDKYHQALSALAEEEE